MPKFKKVREDYHIVSIGDDIYTLEPAATWCSDKWLMTMPCGQTHTVRTIKSANEVLEFHLLATDYLIRLGAEYDRRLHHWYLETLYGKLTISLYDDWVPACFDDVERAKKRFSRFEMNQYSGKWNQHWHTTEDPKDRFKGFCQRIDSVKIAE